MQNLRTLVLMNLSLFICITSFSTFFWKIFIKSFCPIALKADFSKTLIRQGEGLILNSECVVVFSKDWSLKFAVYGHISDYLIGVPQEKNWVVVEEPKNNGMNFFKLNEPNKQLHSHQMLKGRGGEMREGWWGRFGGGEGEASMCYELFITTIGRLPFSLIIDIPIIGNDYKIYKFFKWRKNRLICLAYQQGMIQVNI